MVVISFLLALVLVQPLFIAAMNISAAQSKECKGDDSCPKYKCWIEHICSSEACGAAEPSTNTCMKCESCNQN